MKNKQLIVSKMPLRSLFALLGVFGLLTLSVHAQELTQGYTSDDTLVSGTIVAQIEEDSVKVEPINEDQMDRMFGVVVRSNDSPLTLSEEEQGVFVATEGRFEILVSDLNGEIENGDLITASPFSGVGMKADDRQKLVIATALDSFDVNNPDSILSTTEVQDESGQTHKVAIGRILADIEVRANPNARTSQAVPAFIQNLANTAAQKPVSATRIYAGLGVLVISALIAASLMYSVIRSAIISIGRNPLSKKSVLKGVFQVILISILIFLAGLFAVYLILKV